MSKTPAQGSEELVTVVIPAYNAEATIEETLLSVRAQTHKNLEIIIVDDGSSDATVAVADKHARDDARIVVVQQANAGVAAARNTGWQMAQSDIISFVDADDLWAADKTEQQLAVLRRSPEIGLAYSWYVMIDAASRITLQWPGDEREGDVLRDLLVSNFVGNGSAAMVRRHVLEEVGGFEPGLRNAGAQGCEDILFYCRVAERYPFGLARGHHIGYRYIEGNMSSDLPRMLRSWILVLDEMRNRHPDKLHEMKTGLQRFGGWLVRRAVQLGMPHHLPSLFKILAHESPTLALSIFTREVPKALYDFHRPSARRAAQISQENAAGARFEIGNL